MTLAPADEAAALTLEDLRSDLPDELAELAEQLVDDARFVAHRYPADAPGLWWDSAQEAEVAAAAAIAPARAARFAWRLTPVAVTASVVLLLVCCVWMLSGDDGGQGENSGRGPVAPLGPGLGPGAPGKSDLALPNPSPFLEATPASWTPEAYPDVSGEEEQVLHDELKLIRSAEL
jgi:hypothetical protein